jgi:hypothetical protein
VLSGMGKPGLMKEEGSCPQKTLLNTAALAGKDARFATPGER